METTRIRISGIDRQVDEYSPKDGSCSQIDKLRPSGKVNDPRWEVIPNPLEYTFAPDPTWNIPGSTPFTIVSTHYAFDTWYAFVFFDDEGGSPETALYSCTLASDVLTLDTQLFNAGGSLWIDGSNNLLPLGVFFKDFGPDGFYMLITPGGETTTGQHQIWKITEEGAEPSVFRPELHLVQVTINDETETTADFNVKFPSDRKVLLKTKGNLAGRNLPIDLVSLRSVALTKAAILKQFPPSVVQGGSYPGILKDKDKYFGVITAFKHPNGTWVKHASPHVFKVSKQTASVGTDTDSATLTFGKNPNYTDNSANYDANIGDNFTLYGHKGGGSGSPTPWQQLGEVGVFLTTGKGTREDAYLEGTYYLIGTLDEEDELNWAENEEAIVTGEVLNIDPYSHHIITAKTLGNYGNNLVLVRTVTNFSLPGVEWHNHIAQDIGDSGDGYVLTPKINETISEAVGTVTVEFNNNCAVRVKIETEKGIYYRWNIIALSYTEPTSENYIISLPDFISYPDRQATELTYYWYDSGSGEHELLHSISLKEHPYINIAYNFFSIGIRTILYGLGDEDSEVLDFSDNLEMMVEENEFKVSDITKIFFPLEWSYQINDKISAIANNTNEVAQGQFGDYPIYVFGENSIYGARTGEGVLISKFDKISDQHGMNGFESYAVFENIMYFVSSHGIHALSGIQIEDIYDMVEGLETYFISTDPTTRLPIFQQGSGGVVENSPATLFENILEAVKVAVNTKTREIIFSTSGGLLIFNEKYKQWYTYTVNGEGNVSNPYDFAEYDQLMYANGNLHILEIPEDPTDAKILQWGTGTVSGFFSMVTNPFVINDFSVMKRIRRMLLKSEFIINGAGSDSANGLYALNLVLQGKRSTNTIDSAAPLQDDNTWATLMTITDDIAQTITSKYLKTNYGSFQAFRVLIYGENLSAGSFISDIVSIHQSRGRFVV